MDTSAIGHRVADFLRHHPPFQVVADADLLELAGRGRVRFHEPNDYILWQGEPFRMQVFVIQQGTVSLWDEAGAEAVLRDVRGAGDMLGIEQFNDADVCLYSARSSSHLRGSILPALRSLGEGGRGVAEEDSLAGESGHGWAELFRPRPQARPRGGASRP